MRVVWLSLAVFLSGCGDDGGAPVDGPPAWPGRDLPACDTTFASYVIDGITVPATSTESQALGRDLDDDGSIDNQLGLVIYNFQASGWFDIQGRTDEAIAAGTLDVGLSIERCTDPEYLLVRLHQGGDGAPTGLAAVDRLADGRVVAVRGDGAFPPTALFDADGALWIDAPTFEVELDTVDDTALAGRIALGLDGAAFYAAVVPVIHAFVNEEIAGQPGCPAACEDPDLRSMVQFFDLDGDNIITVEEVAANSLIEAVASPDLDLLAEHEGEQVYWPGQDDVADSLSLGLGFTAARVN